MQERWTGFGSEMSYLSRYSEGRGSAERSNGGGSKHCCPPKRRGEDGIGETKGGSCGQWDEASWVKEMGSWSETLTCRTLSLCQMQTLGTGELHRGGGRSQSPLLRSLYVIDHPIPHFSFSPPPHHLNSFFINHGVLYTACVSHGHPATDDIIRLTAVYELTGPVRRFPISIPHLHLTKRHSIRTTPSRVQITSTQALR